MTAFAGTVAFTFFKLRATSGARAGMDREIISRMRTGQGSAAEQVIEYGAVGTSAN